jgi:IS30 family transposase
LKKNNEESVSHETIYSLMFEDKKRKGNLHKHLRRKYKRYKKRGNNKDAIGKIIGRFGENRP